MAEPEPAPGRTPRPDACTDDQLYQILRLNPECGLLPCGFMDHDDTRGLVQEGALELSRRDRSGLIGQALGEHLNDLCNALHAQPDMGTDPNCPSDAWQHWWYEVTTHAKAALWLLSLELDCIQKAGFDLPALKRALADALNCTDTRPFQVARELASHGFPVTEALAGKAGQRDRAIGDQNGAAQRPMEDSTWKKDYSQMSYRKLAAHTGQKKSTLEDMLKKGKEQELMDGKPALRTHKGKTYFLNAWVHAHTLRK